MIKRELYLKQIRRWIDNEAVKAITGVRRSGKTYILYSIIEELKQKGINEENIFLISFESQKYNRIENFKQLDETINKLVKNVEGKIYLLFDEIQLVEGWQKSINSYRVELKFDLYIKGSNSELLSNELSILMSGRYKEIKIYPFSFKEFLQYKKEINNININKFNEEELFDEYLKYGGMPQLLNINKIDKYSYLEDIYSVIFLKDIIYTHNIRNTDMLNRLLNYIILNIGNTFSANKISAYFKNEGRKISADTILDFIMYATDAYFIHKVPREDLIGKKVLKTKEKYYLIDHGFHQTKIFNTETKGKVLENIVYIELLRRGYNIKVGMVNEKEIDFVCIKNKNKIYIQVCLDLSKEDTKNREFSSLEKVNDNYDKYVLSLDKEDYSNNGFKHRNILEFLKTDEI